MAAPSLSLESKFVRAGGLLLAAVDCWAVACWRFLYGPRLTPFLRSFLGELTQVAVRPSLIQRWHGRPSSHFLQAFWQLTRKRKFK